MAQPRRSFGLALANLFPSTQILSLRLRARPSLAPPPQPASLSSASNERCRTNTARALLCRHHSLLRSELPSSAASCRRRRWMERKAAAVSSRCKMLLAHTPIRHRLESLASSWCHLAAGKSHLSRRALRQRPARAARGCWPSGERPEPPWMRARRSKRGEWHTGAADPPVRYIMTAVVDSQAHHQNCWSKLQDVFVSRIQWNGTEPFRSWTPFRCSVENKNGTE